MIVEIIDVLESSEDLQEDFKILERLAYEIKVHRNIVKILYANKINKQISKELEEQYVEQYIITEEKLLKMQKKFSAKYFSDEKYQQCTWTPDFIQKEIIIEKGDELY